MACKLCSGFALAWIVSSFYNIKVLNNKVLTYFIIKIFTFKWLLLYMIMFISTKVVLDNLCTYP